MTYPIPRGRHAHASIKRVEIDFSLLPRIPTVSSTHGAPGSQWSLLPRVGSNACGVRDAVSPASDPESASQVLNSHFQDALHIFGAVQP